ncbi:hypothetical protein DFAR_4040015 [Desulfarculales bacterium]
MLINPILDKLRTLGLEGMLKALKEQLDTLEAQKLGLEERLGLYSGQGGHPQKKPPAQNRLAKDKLQHDACLEDIDYRQRRRVDKSLIMALA